MNNNQKNEPMKKAQETQKTSAHINTHTEIPKTSKSCTM